MNPKQVVKPLLVLSIKEVPNSFVLFQHALIELAELRAVAAHLLRYPCSREGRIVEEKIGDGRPLQLLLSENNRASKHLC